MRPFQYTEQIEQMCSDVEVKLVYLPPYSPYLNPIEEFFAELKAFIKKNWEAYEDNPEQGFDTFLEWCVDVVGGREGSAKGYFTIEPMCTRALLPHKRLTRSKIAVLGTEHPLTLTSMSILALTYISIKTDGMRPKSWKR